MSEFKPCQDLDLKPCPMCGESLIKHSDHHGEWYAHRLEPGPCILSFMQIFDQKDAAAWNTRSSVEGETVDMEKDNRASADQFMQLVAQNTPLTGEPYYALRDILVMIYETRQAKAIAQLPTPDLSAHIEAAAEEIEMAIEGYNIEQRQWARARSEAGGNIIADGFIGEALLHELNEWDANNPMPRPKTDIAKKIRRHIKISE